MFQAGLHKLIEDRQLLERTYAGDAGALLALHDAHAPRLIAMALLITRCAESAEDVVQEAFVRLWREPLKRNDGTVSGWLATTVWRAACKERARRLALGGIDTIDLPDESASPDLQLIRDDRMRHVAAVIAELSFEHRECLLLRYYAERSYEEIADLLGVPIGTVKSRLYYAVQMCRQKLQARGVWEECM